MTTTEIHSLNENNQSKKQPLPHLNKILERFRIEAGIHGMAVAIHYKGSLIFAEGFGKRNDQDPFTEHTVSAIGSLTKAFTATAIGELVAEGKMDWDTTPVNTYLPEFELKDPVLTSQLTMADLLSHRTNLPNVQFRWIKTKESRIELIKHMKGIEQPSKLTSNLNYNNTMYAVAGEAGARVAGVSYEEFVKTKVFQPLGLSHTGFSQIAMQNFSDYALPYMAESWEDAKKAKFVRGELNEVYLSDAPAGDIHSNVIDLAKWGSVVMKSGEVDGKQVLNKESVEETLRGRTFANGKRRIKELAPVQAYGLGWAIDAYKGYAQYNHNLVVAALSNVYVSALENIPYYVVDQLLDLPSSHDWLFDVSIRDAEKMYKQTAEAAQGQFPKKIENSSPSHSLKDYAGEYNSPSLGPVSILYKIENSHEGEKEVLYFKSAGFYSQMEHYHFDLFRVVLAVFGSAVGMGIKFLMGADGAVKEFAFIESKDTETLFQKQINKA
ncbi:hypothetical protein FBU30_005883 [Linnemannia zychae]|nr:hypothetical protein FBU30_005883 [Linnemannia zychae]